MTPAQATATAAVALLLTAAACSGPGSGVVYNSNYTAGYDPGSLRAAMSRAPLLVETYGTPGDAQAQETVSRATALALRQHGSPWLPRNYTDSPVDAGEGPYRLRVAYGMPKSFDRQRVCTAAMDSAALEAARRETDAGSTRTVASLCRGERTRSEEHTSELQSLMRISYAVFCLKKKKQKKIISYINI